MYLKGIMERKTGAPSERIIEKFQEAITLHFTALRGIPVGFVYFTNLNPEFLMRMIVDLLEYAPQQVPYLLVLCCVCLSPALRNSASSSSLQQEVDHPTRSSRYVRVVWSRWSAWHLEYWRRAICWLKLSIFWETMRELRLT